MHTDNFVKDLFAIVDRMDGASLASKMTEDGVFRFGNIPGITGRDNVTAFLDNFFQSIQAIRHDQLEGWVIDNTRFGTGRVTYTRHNGTELSVPFSVILKMKGGLIHEYLIFVDGSELYKQ
ncbi:MAG TPA: nuclear transport factor 2 family protein [Bacteroidales bacterium]|nr:nuclear transport factor 2 family protein [Bacteroidales bacterium]